MRLSITALATALLARIAPASISARTGIGVLDARLNTRQSADAPNGQRTGSYQKSNALAIGMDHHSGWLVATLQRHQVRREGPNREGIEVTLKKDLKSAELDSMGACHA
jgi:hypothetical protein